MRNIGLFFALRYLFSKKSHNAINIISGISACGVAVATLAMVCTMSVFNGFQDLVAGLFTTFDPQLRVSLVDHQMMMSDDEDLARLKKSPLVKVFTPVMEGQALVVQGGKQQVVTVRGMADNWQKQTRTDDLFYPKEHGQVDLHVDVLEYGVLGIQLAAQLGLTADFPDPLRLYAPKRGERVNMANPLSSFNTDELQSPGVVFMVHQSKYDATTIITSLGFAQRLLDHEDEYSHVHLRLAPGAKKSEVQALLGERFQVLDRYEQQDDVFRIMRVEKLIAYVFLTFILFVAMFNIIGSLSMLMIDKRQDVVTLRNLGATDKQICDIFMLEGRLISMLGAVIGILLGVALCWAQQEFGIVPMGNAEGAFIVESYPVVVIPRDILLVFVTVILVSWLVVWYPVRRLSRRLL